MRSVQLLTGFCDVASGIQDRWFVSIGEGSIGPVDLELLVRGIEAGKVPLDCYVRNEAWTVWRPLSDLVMVGVTCAAEANAADASRHEAAFTLADDDGPPTLRRGMRWEPPAVLEPPPCDSRPTLPRLTRSLQHQNA